MFAPVRFAEIMIPQKRMSHIAEHHEGASLRHDGAVEPLPPLPPLGSPP